jgi:hypothetical protein
MKEMKSEDCGPGCDCGKPSGNKKAKVAICLIVLLAVCGIFVYKATSAKQITPANTGNAFAAPIANQANVQKPMVNSVADKKTVGQFLDSLASLNKVAANKDAVFVFVPANENETIGGKTLDAIASATQKIKSSGVSIGLYTLQSGSPEYANIAAQLPLPGMLVMSKGRGMGAVSGGITEEKILQAYVASSRAGGCGPSSSCGPSTPGCGPSAPALGPRR